MPSNFAIFVCFLSAIVVESTPICERRGISWNKALRFVRGEGTHDNKAPWFVRGEGTHDNKAPRFVIGEGTRDNKAPRFVRGERTHDNKAPRFVRGEWSHDNKAPRFVRGEGTHDNKARWRKEVKIVQQTPRGALWKLLFGYANCRRLWRKYYLWSRSSTQVWALFSETRTLREADISWFRHVASEKRACSLGMRCVTLAARDSCAIFVSLAHRPVPPQRRGLWWPKWDKTASLNARDLLWY